MVRHAPRRILSYSARKRRVFAKDAYQSWLICCWMTSTSICVSRIKYIISHTEVTLYGEMTYVEIFAGVIFEQTMSDNLAK